MKLPNGGASVDQARFDHLYGWATGFGYDAAVGNPPRSRPVLMGLAQARPELNGHALAVVYDEPSPQSLAGAVPDARRILYCPDSSKPREWLQVATFVPQTAGLEMASPTVAVHAGYLYFAAFNHGLKRTPLPTVAANTLKAIRPMLVAPGGRNLLHPSCWIDKKDATTFEAVPKDTTVEPAVWKDGTRVLPQAPSLAERAVRIQTRLANSTSWSGQLRASASTGSTWHNLPSGSQWSVSPNPPQVRRFRGWVLDNSYDRSGLTNPLVPNKTNQLLLRLWDESGVDTGGNMILPTTDDRWTPCTNISVRGLGTGLGLGLRVNGHGSGNDAVKDDNYGFFLPDMALDGNGSLPYPLRADTEGPDEKLAITGLSLATSHSWSIKVAGMMPVSNWDHYAARGLFNQGTGQFDSNRRWPLFTLWESSTRYVEFVADCEERKFRVRYNNGGTLTELTFGDGKQIWLPDSPLFVGIGYDADNDKLHVGASLAGGLVHVLPSGITHNAGTFTQPRFRGATGGYPLGGADGEVCEFRWIGGEVNTTTALTAANLPQAFATLDFLNGP